MQLEDGAREALGNRVSNHQMRPEGNQIHDAGNLLLLAKIHANVNVSGGLAAHGFVDMGMEARLCS